MAKYPVLSAEMFREMMSSDKGIREARYATGYGRWVNGESVTDGHYVRWKGGAWEISPDQMAEAEGLFDRRRAEVFAEVSRKGVLCFHAMGMSYKPTVPDGIGNYRIRSTFKDRTGHVWFVELHPERDPQSFDADESRGCWGEVYDVGRNAAEAARFYKERDRLIGEYGSWPKVPTNLRPSPPMCHYENVGIPGPFSFGAVLDWVNRRFGADYKKMVLERHFLQCNDTISEC